MKLQELDDQIQDLHQKQIKQDKLAARISDLEEQIIAGNLMIESKKKQMEKEQSDVHRLENLSIKKIYTNILGSTQEELVKEREEYLNAVFAYNGIVDQQEATNYEYNLLLQKKSEQLPVKNQLDALIGKKEFYLKRRSNKISRAIEDYNVRLQILNIKLLNEEEALKAGIESKSSIDKLYNVLSEIRMLIRRPQHVKGRASSYRIQQLLHQSSQLAAISQTRLNHYQKELKDVFQSAQLNIELSSFKHFLNQFYKFFVFEWVKQKSLNKVIDDLKSINQEVVHHYKELEKIHDKHRSDLDLLKKEKRSYLITAKV